MASNLITIRIWELKPCVTFNNILKLNMFYIFTNFTKFTMLHVSHITNCSINWIKKHRNNCLNWFFWHWHIFSQHKNHKSIQFKCLYRLREYCNYLIIIAIKGASIWWLSSVFTYHAENHSNEMKLRNSIQMLI